MSDNPEFVRPARVRAFANRHGRRMGRDFLQHLEQTVVELLNAAVADYNDGKVTLDIALARRCRRTLRGQP